VRETPASSARRTNSASEAAAIFHHARAVHLMVFSRRPARRRSAVEAARDPRSGTSRSRVGATRGARLRMDGTPAAFVARHRFAHCVHRVLAARRRVRS
jgi:hypothetical protein